MAPSSRPHSCRCSGIGPARLEILRRVIGGSAALPIGIRLLRAAGPVAVRRTAALALTAGIWRGVCLPIPASKEPSP